MKSRWASVRERAGARRPGLGSAPRPEPLVERPQPQLRVAHQRGASVLARVERAHVQVQPLLAGPVRAADHARDHDRRLGDHVAPRLGDQEARAVRERLDRRRDAAADGLAAAEEVFAILDDDQPNRPLPAGRWSPRGSAVEPAQTYGPEAATESAANAGRPLASPASA